MTAPEKRDPIPLLITLADMVELFPVAKQTVYRWRVKSPGRNVQLPDPDLTIARTPVWREEVVREFAARHGYTLDEKVLRRLSKEQGHA